ncbi:putative membrane protein YfcA [Streptomyces pseudovenezuelae]|uniref:Probable membrane transporter protein n=1 Tax=Streptomyces pseudovenezuelae TaxID=67350 RepID=A0ABT6LEJ9_9ACTN|nr:sulfite exporter TauE/SafE family protein [Streptomyces pseudovenezuelae]MDH6214742.1 putative membrane protein YfcA [Streptomyces pseudovenezuelae]
MVIGGWTGDVLLAGIVLLGSSVQWLTGMGFALVAVPALILLLGPAEGVVLANCAAGVISVVGLAGGWRRVRLGAMVPLCAAAACTVPAGAWLTRQLPAPVLLLVMGALVTVAVLLVMRGARVPALRGTKGAVAAGAAGGFMNSAAGVGGPPISLYALNAGWTVREFVPNAQFYGVIVNAFSVAANGVPTLSTPKWVSVAVAMAVGGAIGRGLSDRIPERRARQLVLSLALAGGVTAVGKGLWGL